MALAFLLTSPARAAHWAVTYACSGTNTLGSGTPVSWTPTQNTNPAVEGCGYSPLSPSAVSNGSLTATLTWTSDGEPRLPPAPSKVYLLQTLTCSATGSSAGATVTDGWGDTFPGSGTVNCTGKFAHSLQMDNSALKTTLTLQPVTATVSAYNSTGAGGNCYASIQLTTAAVNYALSITFTGTTPDSSGADNILVGQGCTAALSAMGGAVSSPYQWSVSGSTFQSWNGNGPLPVAAVKGSGILTNSTAQWYWNDLGPKPTSETVSCTAMVTPTGQSPISVTATKTVVVQVPVVGTGLQAGYMQVNTSDTSFPNNYALWAGPPVNNQAGADGGMVWQATVQTPQTPAFGRGSLEIVQLDTPNDSYTTNTTPVQTHTDPLDTAAHAKGLDVSYPYQKYVFAESTDPKSRYSNGDAPGLLLTGLLVNGKPSSIVAASASFNGDYYDYLMYQPPSSGTPVSWVTVGTLHWNVTSSATLPDPKLWPNGWQDYKKAHGSDSAGTVTPDQNSFTPDNTFPAWTIVNTPQGY